MTTSPKQTSFEGLVQLLDRPAGSPLDWDAMAARVPWHAEMAASSQDPIYHAEGDVWTHTVMVVEALRQDPALWDLADFDRQALLVTALLHDVAKPETRVEEFSTELGRVKVSNPHHALKGARASWAFLWKLGADVEMRERVFALIAWHQKVFHALSKPEPRDEFIAFSHLATWRDLVMLAQADNRGRISPNTKETAIELECVRLAAEELGCLDTPWAFSNDEARVIFCREKGKSPFYEPRPPAGSRVIVLSGIPGSGKNTYAAKAFSGLPQVSFDDLREDEDDPGRVMQLGYELAREHLRKKQAFVWNATNTNKLMRDRIISLARSYDAHIEIHALDTPYPTVLKQNRAREAQVPESAIDRFIDRWQPPTPLEAHQVFWVSPDHTLRPAFANLGAISGPELAAR